MFSNPLPPPSSDPRITSLQKSMGQLLKFVEDRGEDLLVKLILEAPNNESEHFRKLLEATFCDAEAYLHIKYGEDWQQQKNLRLQSPDSEIDRVVSVSESALSSMDLRVLYAGAFALNDENPLAQEGIWLARGAIHVQLWQEGRLLITSLRDAQHAVDSAIF